jgi:hypothetical protein
MVCEGSKFVNVLQMGNNNGLEDLQSVVEESSTHSNFKSWRWLAEYASTIQPFQGGRAWWWLAEYASIIQPFQEGRASKV